MNQHKKDSAAYGNAQQEVKKDKALEKSLEGVVRRTSDDYKKADTAQTKAVDVKKDIDGAKAAHARIAAEPDSDKKAAKLKDFDKIDSHEKFKEFRDRNRGPAKSTGGY